MKKFLETIILDNSVQSYLLVVAAILFLLLVKKYLSQSVAALLFLFVRNHWKTIEKKEFVSVIIKPLSWLITISLSIFAIDKLNFPSAWNFSIYGHRLPEIFEKVATCLIIVYFVWLMISLVDFISLIFVQKAKLTKDKNDDQLIVFFRDFLKAILTILGLLLLLKAGFNQNIGTVLTGLSIVGAAMALAAKESLENLIASFIIFFDKPFYTGDTLKVNNVMGKVEHIGLRSTRIRTIDKTLVTVPNKQMVDSIVDNLSMRIQRRAEIRLEFDAKSATADIEELIQEIETTLAKYKQEIEDFSVFFSEFNKNGLTITVEYFTVHSTMADFNQLKQKINIFVKKTIEELKLELASAGSDINIFNGENSGAAQKNQPII